MKLITEKEFRDLVKSLKVARELIFELAKEGITDEEVIREVRKKTGAAPFSSDDVKYLQELYASDEFKAHIEKLKAHCMKLESLTEEEKERNGKQIIREGKELAREGEDINYKYRAFYSGLVFFKDTR